MLVLFLFISYSSHLLSLMLFTRLVDSIPVQQQHISPIDIIPIFVIIRCSYLRSFSSSSSSSHLLTLFLSYQLLISPTDTLSYQLLISPTDILSYHLISPTDTLPLISSLSNQLTPFLSYQLIISHTDTLPPLAAHHLTY